MGMFCLAFCIIIGFSTSALAQQSSSIPSWVKNTAKWWHENSIGDDEFMKGIQYLIQQKIIKISDTQQGSQSMQHIPSWVKNIAGFWVDGKTSDDDFTKAIEYLVKVGIIQVNVTSTQINTQSPTIPTPTINTKTNSSAFQNSTASSNNLGSTPSLLGSGINLKIVNNTASGTLALNGKQYSASNLLWIKKGDQIQLTGYIVGSDSVLLETAGVHTTGIEYKFYGSIMSNGKSEPVTFTALLTNPAGRQSTTNTIPNSITAPQVPAKLIQKMIVLIRNTDRLFVQYPYSFAVKVFDPKINPTPEFDSFYGTIPNVKFTVTIHKGSDVLHQFQGSTGSYGMYSDSWRLTFTPDQSQYDVDFNATKAGFQDKSVQEKVFTMHPSQGKFNSTGSK